MFRDLSFRSKLIFLSSGIGGGAVLVVTLTLVVILWADLRRTSEESAAALAALVARGSPAALLFDDPHAATENLRAFAVHADVEVAALFDRDGNLFASYVRDEVAHASHFLPDVLTQAPANPSSTFRDGHVVAYQSVVVRGAQVGTAMVVVGLERVYHNVSVIARSVVVTMIAALLLMVAFSARLQRIVSAPVLALAGVMDRVTRERDYTVRATVDGSDELAALGRGFNDMLAQIQARDQALERHGEALERTVEARTRELARTNARLTEELAERERAEALVRSQNEALESLGAGKPLVVTLEAVCRFLESQLPGARCAVLAMAPEGNRLRHVCAPHLPAAYTTAIDDRPVGPDGVRAPVDVGHPAPMFTDDVSTHPMWEGARDLALAAGLRSCWCVPVNGPKGGLVGRISVYHDVVTRRPDAPQMRLLETAAAMAGMALERELAQARLAQMAHYDGLTGLPNRRMFTDRLAQALGRARRRQGRVAVLFIDLDRFKPVNDILGHAVGDEVLKELADRLRGALREEDTLARIGGDEFTVILEEVTHREDAVRVAERLLAAVTPPFEVEGQEVVVGASAGIALSPDDGTDAPTLVKNADMAMYRAKQSGRGVFCFYVGEMAAEASARLRMEGALRHALERKEFRVYLQPQVEAAGGRLVGAEALLRWDNEELGSVPPAVFVPILEDTGLIFPVGEWVLAEACRIARAWPDVHGEPLRIAVNLSGRQLHQADPAALVARVLSETGLPASRLELELTESVVMEHAGETVERLNALEALGVRLTVDDFGTGYSSLSYLKAFPIRALKIDRSFVHDITDDEGDRAIAAAVISLAHSLNLYVVAEGVETAEQLTVLRGLGCDLAQGYLFGRPEPAEDFAARLTALGPVPEQSPLK